MVVGPEPKIYWKVFTKHMLNLAIRCVHSGSCVYKKLRTVSVTILCCTSKLLTHHHQPHSHQLLLPSTTLPSHSTQTQLPALMSWFFSLFQPHHYLSHPFPFCHVGSLHLLHYSLIQWRHLEQTGPILHHFEQQ